MNFRPPRMDDDLEINLIPLIDVLLVILIFLAATTSFTRLRQLNVELPKASADAPAPAHTMTLAISQDGLYALNGDLLDARDAFDIAQALQHAAAGRGDVVLIINADTQSSHGSVVRVLEAARLAHISKVNFATQSP